MTLHPILLVADDSLAEACERHWLDGKAGLLANLARHRLVQGLAGLDHAAWQAENAIRRRQCPAHDKDLAVAHDGGACGEEGAIWIESLVGHDVLLRAPLYDVILIVSRKLACVVDI